MSSSPNESHSTDTVTTTASTDSDQLFDRLQEIRPRLSAHIRILPQTYRGTRWFVLANESRGNFMRFNQHAYAAIGRFDGCLTLADILATVNRKEMLLSKRDLAALVIQLANFEALHDALPEDVAALTANRGQGLNRSIINPLALRFPLFDPDRLLDLTLPIVRPLFGKAFMFVWIVAVIFAAVLAISNINELASTINTSLLAPGNIMLGVAVFIVIKIVHEFAHAFAVKMWGGEVHEMGVSLLVLMPVPYVDASASWAFRSKYRRVLVGAVGIIVEIFIAAIALIVFVGIEPGVIKDIALNAMLIGSFSTLLINGNPLLRFDGYYVLQDLLELPNLASRSSRYLTYLVQRHVLKIESAKSPATGPGEKPWLLCYGIAAGIYRLLILAVIALFLASKYLAVGVALITWAVIMQLILPTLKGIWFVLKTPHLSKNRPIAMFRAAIIPAALVLLLGYVPVKYSTTVQGVVWVPDQAQLYSKSEGMVVEVLVPHGQQVTAGTPIISLHNPDLELRRHVITAKLNELETKRRSIQFSNRSGAEATEREKDSVLAELDAIDEELIALTIRSPVTGTLVYTNPTSFEGTFVKQGALVAYVVDPEEYIVRSVVTQADIGHLRAGIDNVEIRLAENLNLSLPGTILRETPAGTHHLPGQALSRAGGGPIDMETSERTGTRTVTEIFTIDLALPKNTVMQGIGGRAFVRYQHQPSPLLVQWKERVQQLLLRRLAV